MLWMKSRSEIADRQSRELPGLLTEVDSLAERVRRVDESLIDWGESVVHVEYWRVTCRVCGEKTSEGK
jgi:hypothetical protein